MFCSSICSILRPSTKACLLWPSTLLHCIKVHQTAPFIELFGKACLWLQAQGKAEEEEREDGEIADSEKQSKAEEKKQKAREDMEAAKSELKV